MQDRSSIFPSAAEEQAGKPNHPGESHAPLLMPDGRNAAAVMLGRRGGLKGGIARAERLSSERRREIALKAASARWEKKGAKIDERE